ncbi:PspC domain-containing protein [Umezawaea sp.]|uniref:PspC domain-containing protein n=1 Tax=Umezawaea sp. TaxID=1955258 RepID=UPI002ED1FF5F
MTNNVLNGTTDRVKKLRRSRGDRMLGGVCGGAAKALGVDAALLRIGLVAATLLGFGTGAVLYVACWVLIPEETSTPDLYQPQDTPQTF